MDRYLFTATSATTVTGLVVVDTGTDFTVFGQSIIILLMQIGGLGLMTFAVIIVMMLGKRVGLKDRALVQEAFNQPTISGVIRLVKAILLFAFTIELIAFLFLAYRWVPEFGWGEGLFISLFHTVSAFNNAGLSVWSDSLTGYVGDPLINIVITFLFITGGIGFTVLADIWNKKSYQKLSLHSKLMIIGTLAINLIAMMVLFFLEYSNPETMGQLPLSDKIWASYFQAVTPRTAGFNSIDIGSMHEGSIVMMLVLMFIGAGSASTGSGIKVTTFLVIVIAVATFLRGKDEMVAYQRKISHEAVTRSLAIVIISLMFLFVAIWLLVISENASFLMLVFEAFSAFGTVGLSMGITAELTDFGKVVIAILMFIGRIGPLTIAFSLSKPRRNNRIRHPDGEVFVG